MENYPINLNSESFKKVCINTYGYYDKTLADRFSSLQDAFLSTFDYKDVSFYSSPGRIEIIGNHTDHNGGKVLCAAINYDTLAAVSKSEDGIIEIQSDGYPMMRVDVNRLTLVASEIGTSQAIIKGVVDYYLRSGKKVGGFKACMTANVPKGSGVSSSSSFELVIAEILNVLYNDSKLDDIYKAKASQYAENVYFGKPCGLMDQCAISLGGVNLIDFKDFENPIVEKANWDFDDLGIVVIATGGDHSNLTADYAAIPSEMKKVAALFDTNILGNIPKSLWDSKKDSIKKIVTAREFLRAEHFFEETERVDNIIKAIDSMDEKSFIDIVNLSGLSSRYKLQNTYSPACKNKNIENALDYVKDLDGVVASRVHGGGFAGTILVFVKKESNACDIIENKFGKENVFKMSIRKTGACRLF